MTFRTHLDGHNFMPFFKGNTATPPRREIFYFDDNANLNAMRYGDWKIHFKWIEGNLFTGSIRTANVPLSSTSARILSSAFRSNRICTGAGTRRSSGRSRPPRRSSGAAHAARLGLL
jgi:hypothetical protein